MLVADTPRTPEDNDRFKAPRLGPVQGRGWRTRSVLAQGHPSPLTGPTEAGGRSRQPARLSLGLGSLKVFDRVLLAVEVACALVVLWLVWQYIYTAYLDVAPRRLSAHAPQSGSEGTPAGHSATSRAAHSPTPTRIAQVAPPLVGGPPGTNGTGERTAPGRHMATVTITVTATPTGGPTPTPAVDPRLLLPTRLRIPVMFLDSQVEQVRMKMDTWEVSPMLVGHHEGTGNPGQAGNVVLAAHRDVNSALFRDLDRLKPGDEIFVSNSLREYRYVVKESFVVRPDQTEVMSPTQDSRVTLITCTPIGLATQRLVVIAVLDEQQ